MEALINSLTEWVTALPQWLTALTALVGGATALTAMTPTQYDNKILAAISRLLNVLAGNFAKNKNADDV